MNSTKLLNNFMVPIKVIFCEFINSTTHVQCSHFILLLRYNHCLDCPMAVNQYHDQNANTQAWREKYFTYFSPSVCVGIFFLSFNIKHATMYGRMIMWPCMVLINSGMIRIHNTWVSCWKYSSHPKKYTFQWVNS